MGSYQFSDKPVLLDGGLGRELRFRGVAVPDTIWSTGALLTDPAVVRQIHLDYIAAGAKAACGTGRPVWVAWTLHEDQSGNLRSGESITEAAEMLKGLPVHGLLANCCAPESVTRAMPSLVATDTEWVGGYANTFTPIPQDWELDGEKESDGSLSLRSDLDPESYAVHANEWLKTGATVVGGCCGTRPSHIAKIRSIIDEKKIPGDGTSPNEGVKDSRKNSRLKF